MAVEVIHYGCSTIMKNLTAVLVGMRLESSRASLCYSESSLASLRCRIPIIQDASSVDVTRVPVLQAPLSYLSLLENTWSRSFFTYPIP